MTHCPSSLSEAPSRRLPYLLAINGQHCWPLMAGTLPNLNTLPLMLIDNPVAID
ncbi:hypothetical protein [Halomonas sp. KHS3]|uniref:hypothetical protein n=1 Tax=Halomonas sp. KHS3 TaxID=866350 RepID=UPI00137913CC|nr:hypothetical protein [Halomonas sp. KHS3]